MTEAQTGDEGRPQADRVLLAKIGLDGHDRGIKVIARTARDAGYEVIYTGLFQTPAAVAQAAVDEDVDAICVSMLSGAHEALMPLVTEGLRAAGANIPVVLGGIIPDDDVDAMYAVGMAAVLGPDASAERHVEALRSAIDAARAAS